MNACAPIRNLKHVLAGASPTIPAAPVAAGLNLQAALAAAHLLLRAARVALQASVREALIAPRALLRLALVATGLALLPVLPVSAAPADTPMPRLERRGEATQLVVDGKPYLILGGELHNSSSSNLAYLRPLWAPLKAQHLNTALVAVSWELTEAEEGRYDFSLVDGILADARSHGMKVILLWFGSWKNGLSHYVPAWVKRDTARFPRVRLDNGRQTETLSAVSRAAAQADARAFAALMRHVRQVDAQQRTVIMVQVENEIGVIGAARDYSDAANAAFAQPVPGALLAHLRKHQNDLQPQLAALWQAAGGKSAGTWSEVFGQGLGAHEAFMAWHYATYVQAVTAAGKAEYPLPMFVNAWLVQPEDRKPGDYPSGGPQAHVHDIWRAGAPAVDLLAPDIYLPDTPSIAAAYHHPWNPLFIPESFAGDNGAANAFYVIGRHQALGYSPFGIDVRPDTVAERPIDSTTTPIARAYRVLEQLTPAIMDAQSKGSITGFSVTSAQPTQSARLGGYLITATLRRDWKGVAQVSRGYGMVLHTGPDSFTVAGADLDVSFQPEAPGPRQAGIIQVREGQYREGAWVPGRVLNGDDIMMSYQLASEAAASRTGTGVRLRTLPSISRVQLYRFD